MALSSSAIPGGRFALSAQNGLDANVHFTLIVT